ncbi:unnamed protein product [Pleuronectes platessa]|uniref:Uncharacterized protein n=1 Tax=Pleuronectes platessa TaxID=8262 RepID=A0A9N7VPN9_PLEPL|nr:unnamed protein product [Pleuronectes platessa]
MTSVPSSSIRSCGTVAACRAEQTVALERILLGPCSGAPLSGDVARFTVMIQHVTVEKRGQQTAHEDISVESISVWTL